MSGAVGELRFGVIGCGGMPTQVHCPNLAAIPGARLVAYCDLDEAKAKKLLAAHGGEYTTTEAERVLSDKRIDAVIIAIGPKVHPTMVQAAARGGKHIFVEKPLAADLGEALEAVRAVEKAGVKFQHGTCNRLAPMVRIAQRMCPRPFYSYCHAASTVTHMPVHNLDLAVNLFHNSPLVRVYAGGGQMWRLETDKDLPADSYGAILTFGDGSVHSYLQHGNIVNTFLTKYHYELFGQDCCVYLAKRFKECHFMRNGALERTWKFEGSDVDRGPFGYMGHYEELADLVNCIRDGGTPAMTVRQAAYVCAVEKAILRSIETHAAVDFAEFLQQHGAGFLLRS